MSQLDGLCPLSGGYAVVRPLSWAAEDDITCRGDVDTEQHNQSGRSDLHAMLLGLRGSPLSSHRESSGRPAEPLSLRLWDESEREFDDGSH